LIKKFGTFVGTVVS